MVIFEKESVSAGQLKNLEFEENRPCQKILKNNIGDNFRIRLINTKFPTDERHGQTLRQLLDKAKILRKVFKFIKDKKLTGEQTQELVQTIKSEPRFTINEVYNNLITCRPKPKTKKELVEIIASNSQSLIKNIHQLNINNVEDREKEELKKNLLAATKEIQNIIKTF